MTDEKLKEIEERANKATPKPWKPSIGGVQILTDSEGEDAWFFPRIPVLAGPEKNKKELIDQTLANVEFIRHSRQDVPDLITEIRRLKDWQVRAVVELEADCQNGCYFGFEGRKWCDDTSPCKKRKLIKEAEGE